MVELLPYDTCHMYGDDYLIYEDKWTWCLEPISAELFLVIKRGVYAFHIIHTKWYDFGIFVEKEITLHSGIVCVIPADYLMI